jgi:hypothetical protein
MRRGHLWLHAGVDLFNRGRPVVAPTDGQIVAVGRPDPKKKTPFGGYGPYVVAIKDGDGLYHWLAHVDSPIVGVKERVAWGQVVALKTGTKVPHCHWSIRQILIPYSKKAYWPWVVSIDPVRWLKFSELTAVDAIMMAENNLGEKWKDKKARMDYLRGRYPVKLGWEKSVRDSITIQAQQRMKPKQAEIAAGVFAGASVLAAVLL